MLTLKCGTKLYHGTSLDFDPAGISAGSWFSTSQSVAEYFAKRFPLGDEEAYRLHEYELTEDVDLPDFYDRQSFEAYLEEQGIEAFCSEELVEGILSAGLPGWVIPNNYPDGDDIMLGTISALQFVRTTTLD